MAKKKKDKVEVMADSLEALADNVAELSKVGKAITKSRLNEKTILLLLSNSCALHQYQIKSVLDALADLENKFIKKTNTKRGK